MSKIEKTGDFFADIALLKREKIRKGLMIPGPQKLPRIVLPLKSFKKELSFKPMNKIDDPRKLTNALELSRKNHQKFLNEEAPLLQSCRQQVKIIKFDWKTVKENTLEEMRNAHSGKGKWEKVEIPHYGGPIGRATAYYRTTFLVSDQMLKQGELVFVFKGVDYKAQVYVNRESIGSHEGFFSPFELVATRFIKVGLNELLVRVDNDSIMMGNMSWGGKTDGDKIYASTGIGWDDPELGWHHCPPGMGIYNDVYLESRSTVHIKDVFVQSNLKEKRAEVLVEVQNLSAESVSFSLHASLFGRNFKKIIFKNKNLRDLFEHDGAFFRSKQNELLLMAGPGVNFFRFPIEIEDLQIWAPEHPWLYELQIEIKNKNGITEDTFKRSFGMRSFDINEVDKPFGRFALNGKEIRLRGANTMGFEQHNVMRKDWAQLVDDILLAKIANFNFLRLTQRPVQEEIYDYCDRLGLMVQTDLPLFGVVRPNQFCELIRQVEEMERLIRSHPACILVTFINEPFGFNMGGVPHRHMTRQELEIFFIAAKQSVYLSNPHRAIKEIDGDYDAPGPGIPDNHCYNGWYGNHGLDIGRQYRGYWQPVKKDWMFGCGEYGAEGLDPVSLMRRRYPKKWLPQNEEQEARWTPHSIIKSQTGDFHHVFFDTPSSLEEWVSESHDHQAWVVRLQSEAFRRESRLNTCAVHLFIDAFPSGWMKSIMDCERQPKKAFYAIRDAFTPKMVNLRSDRWGWFSNENIEVEAWICNDTHQEIKGSKLRYQLEINGKILLSSQSSAHVPLCSSRFQGKIIFSAPAVECRTNGVLRLGWFDSSEKLIHDAEFKFTIFPKRKIIKKPSVSLFEKKDRKGSQLLKELGWRASRNSTEILFVTDFDEFLSNEKYILGCVESGSTLVIANLPAKTYKIAGSEVEVVECKMGPRNFISRKTGHTMVQDFEKNDFKFWKEKKSDSVLPILSTSFRAKGWSPILATGEPGECGENGTAWVGKNWEKTMAVGEINFGKGVIRICQVHLLDRLTENPVAAIFAQKLLSK